MEHILEKIQTEHLTPITFTAIMARQIYEGVKIETRRVCAVQPPPGLAGYNLSPVTYRDRYYYYRARHAGSPPADTDPYPARYPAKEADSYPLQYPCINANCEKLGYWIREPYAFDDDGTLLYLADHLDSPLKEALRWIPAFLMRAEYSRAIIQGESCKVEPVSFISIKEAQWEGANPYLHSWLLAKGETGVMRDEKDLFRVLWNRLNAHWRKVPTKRLPFPAEFAIEPFPKDMFYDEHTTLIAYPFYPGDEPKTPSTKQITRIISIANPYVECLHFRLNHFDKITGKGKKIV